MNDNKKTLVLSIVGVFVLILVVVGVSYAMYTFTGTGTTENVITTGSINVELDPATSPITGVTIDKQTITLENQYPMTDEEGLKSTEVLRFYVSATVSGSTTINYEIGMDKQESTLQDDEVKVQLTKKIGTGDSTPVKGTATTGVLVSTFAGDAGSLSGTKITNYFLDRGAFTATGIVTYEMKMWVDENYVLPIVADPTPDDKTHTNSTTSENYSFKIKAYASQVA